MILSQASTSHSQRTQAQSTDMPSQEPAASLHGPLQVIKMISKSTSQGLFTAQRLLFVCTAAFHDSSVGDFPDIVKVAARCVQAAPSYIECALDPSKEAQDLMRVYSLLCERMASVVSDAQRLYDTENKTRLAYGLALW